MTLRFLVLPVGLLLSSGLVVGCSGGEAPPSAKGTRATPKKDDPKLTRHWEMKAEHSPMAVGDLGAEPDAVAGALFDAGMPGVTHRVAKKCGESGALKGAASVALRFAVTDAGVVGPVAAEPAGAAATCMGEGFTAEMADVKELPAGTALLRIKFHPSK